MVVVISYDVREDRRRTRLAHVLKDFGERVQLSVFKCRLDEKQLARLRVRVTKEIELKEDSVRIYRLCGECAGIWSCWGRE